MKMKLTARNLDQVIFMLSTKPLPYIRSQTGLSYSTLFKLAKLYLEH